MQEGSRHNVYEETKMEQETEMEIKAILKNI